MMDEQTTSHRLPQVAIVGRPNVGKSTLFNRLAGRRQAIVHSQPGVTRDRMEATVSWATHRFVLVDTGGVTKPGAEPVTAIVWEQVEAAIASASLLVLVFDARAGLTPYDADLAHRLRRTGRPVLVVANKCEGPAQVAQAAEFAALGLGEPIPISAEHGRNIGTLLDAVVARLASAVSASPQPPSQATAEPSQVAPLRLAIVGRPNVGKSSLINAVVGAPRVAVHAQPGTTRDAVDVELTHGGRPMVLIDTAGITRRARPGGADLEAIAVARALSAMERCDVAILVVDATVGVTFQDVRLAGRAARLGCGLVVAVNKWDKIGHHDPKQLTEYVPQVQQALREANWAEVTFVSALTGWRVPELLQLAQAVGDRRASWLDAGILRAVVLEAADRRPPPAPRGSRGALRLGDVRQSAINPPTVRVQVMTGGRARPGASPVALSDSYLRYLENQLRRRFNLLGVPVRLVVHSSGGSKHVDG